MSVQDKYELVLARVTDTVCPSFVEWNPEALISCKCRYLAVVFA